MDVRVLGPLEVDVDGRAVDLGSPLQQMVFAVLACRANEVVSVDRLIEDVWGDDPPTAVTAAIQSYIARLRRVLEPDRQARAESTVIVTQAPGYVLRIEPESIDAGRFRRLVRQADDLAARGSHQEVRTTLEAALALWRGDAYASFPYRDFAASEVLELTELRVDARLALARALLALGDPAGAANHLGQVIAAHPLREDARELQMRSLYLLGRQTDALAVYDDIRRRLTDELGLDPGPDLQRMQLQILNHDPALRDASEPVGARENAVATPGPRTVRRDAIAQLTFDDPWGSRRLAPLIGREAELERLDDIWQRVVGGSACVCVLAGPAGVGKTRLAGEFAARLQRDDCLVLWGRCTEETLTPYQPVVEALGRCLGDRSIADPYLGRSLEMLVPGCAATAADGAEPDRYTLFAGVATLLANTCERVPVLFVIDDAHWMDASTVSMLVTVVRQITGSRLLLLMTSRDAERSDSEARSMTSELQRDRMLETVEVPGLDATSVAELVRHLEPTTEEAVVDAIRERAEGNPYFVEEMVGAGRVSHRTTSPHAPSPMATAVPSTIRAVLDRRVNQLGERARLRLRAAAVLGREFDTDLVAAVCEVEPLDLLDDLEAAMSLDLLVEAPDVIGRFAFAHALLRDALLEGMSDLRRRHFHRAAAAAIARGVGRGVGRGAGPSAAGWGVDARVAHHLLAGGFREDVSEAAERLLSSARQASQVFAFQEAIDSCRTALSAADDHPSALRYQLLSEQGAAELASGLHRDARATFLRAAEIARSEGDGRRLADVMIRSLQGSLVTVEGFFGKVDTARAALIEEALTLLGDDEPAVRVELLGHLATVLLHDTDPRRRDEVADEAVRLADTLGIPRLGAIAYGAKRTALEASRTSDLAERLRIADVARTHADASDDPTLRVMLRIATIDEAMSAGEVELFDRLLDESEALVAPFGQPRFHWFIDCARAGRALFDGDYDRASELIEAARTRAGGTLGVLPLGAHLQQRALLDRDLGRPEAIVERLSALPISGPGTASLRAALCLAAALSGRIDLAADLLRAETDQGFASDPIDGFWSGTIAWFGEAASLIGDERAATMIDQQLAGRERQLAVLGGSGVTGTLGRVRGLIATMHGDLVRAESLLGDALDQMRSIGSPPWVARITADLAAVVGRRGDEERAAALLLEADELAAGIGLVLGREG